jgi:hypothetical protein
VTVAEPAPRSPEAWVAKLNAELDKRRATTARWNDYYEGNHPLPAAPERAQGAFTRWLKQSRSNYTALVVDTSVERLGVQGIRYGKDQGADSEAWDLWQANDLDTGSEMVHLEAHIAGESYVTVEPNPDDATTPLILPEHPDQMIVACDPASPVAGWPRSRSGWTTRATSTPPSTCPTPSTSCSRSTRPTAIRRPGRSSGCRASPRAPTPSSTTPTAS